MQNVCTNIFRKQWHLSFTVKWPQVWESQGTEYNSLPRTWSTSIYSTSISVANYPQLILWNWEKTPGKYSPSAVADFSGHRKAVLAANFADRSRNVDVEEIPRRHDAIFCLPSGELADTHCHWVLTGNVGLGLQLQSMLHFVLAPLQRACPNGR